MPLRLHPTALVARYRSFLKYGKAPSLASASSRAQALLFCIFPDDVDGLSIRKAETSTRPGRTAYAKGAKQNQNAAFIHIHLVAAKKPTRGRLCSDSTPEQFQTDML
jgi:hypothetical protein